MAEVWKDPQENKKTEGRMKARLNFMMNNFSVQTRIPVLKTEQFSTE